MILVGVAVALGASMITTGEVPGVGDRTGATPSAHQTMTFAPLPTIAPTTVPPPAAASTSLEGRGSKTGPTVALSGAYVLKASVKMRKGCRFQLYLDGSTEVEPIYETAAAKVTGAVRVIYKGRDTLVMDEDFEYGPYAFRVVARKCGPWSVTLRRP
jgi:hypothetical protein